MYNGMGTCREGKPNDQEKTKKKKLNQSKLDGVLMATSNIVLPQCRRSSGIEANLGAGAGAGAHRGGGGDFLPSTGGGASASRGRLEVGPGERSCQLGFPSRDCLQFGS